MAVSNLLLYPVNLAVALVTWSDKSLPGSRWGDLHPTKHKVCVKGEGDEISNQYYRWLQNRNSRRSGMVDSL